MLEAAFEDAQRAGTPRTIWWRDDDAVRRGPKLDALARLASTHGAPLALAVIPARVQPDLLSFAVDEGLAVLQHGIAHENHEREGKPAELGAAREVATILARCVEARARLASPSFVPVMVPPWNRMRPDLAPALALAGYRGVSLFGQPEEDRPLARIDTHIDPIAWRTTRDLHENDALEAMVRRALQTHGPIGLLTHHDVHTRAVDTFVDALASLVSRHGGARWANARDLFRQ